MLGAEPYPRGQQLPGPTQLFPGGLTAQCGRSSGISNRSLDILVDPMVLETAVANRTQVLGGYDPRG